MKLCTINEAAPILGKSSQRLRRGVKSGKYPFVQIGGRTLVDVDELDEIIKIENATIGIEEAAKLTGLPVSAVRRGVREGWLPAKKYGKAYELKPGEVLAALRAMKQNV